MFRVQQEPKHQSKLSCIPGTAVVPVQNRFGKKEQNTDENNNSHQLGTRVLHISTYPQWPNNEQVDGQQCTRNSQRLRPMQELVVRVLKSTLHGQSWQTVGIRPANYFMMKVAQTIANKRVKRYFIQSHFRH